MFAVDSGEEVTIYQHLDSKYDFMGTLQKQLEDDCMSNRKAAERLVIIQPVGSNYCRPCDGHVSRMRGALLMTHLGQGHLPAGAEHRDRKTAASSDEKVRGGDVSPSGFSFTE